MSTIKTGFLAGPNGRLHLSVFLPENTSWAGHWVIHVPAFAEEMNKCRPMVSRQARRCAENGIVVIVPDLYGTGDSEGEFFTTGWDVWKADLKCLIAWSQSQGADNITLWGIRLGCLLAADVAQQGGESVSALLLWQPVHNGRQYMTQFLRLRMAAAIMQGDSENVAQLREMLLQGESIEVAGYQLSPLLFTQIEEVAMTGLKIPSRVDIEILEVVGDIARDLLPVSRKQIEKWQSLGIECAAATVQGEPFWMTQEIAFAPSLIEKTASSLACLAPSSAEQVARSADSAVLPSFDAKIHNDQVGLESIVFPCENEELVGLLHLPKVLSKVGIVIVVGGPQYRVGSHRQFVLLARFLVDRGIPVLRFDYRGMGDSSGELRGFEGVNKDIRCAIDVFQRKCRSTTDIVIWGLCDAATAAVFYAVTDKRVKGLILLNPWIYSRQGAAKALMKRYYLRRFFSKALWRKILNGEFNPVESWSSVLDMMANALGRGARDMSAEEQKSPTVLPHNQSGNLVSRFTYHLEKFTGEVLFILSGEDLTAAEFIDAADNDRELVKLMERGGTCRKLLPEADHTFSRCEWSAKVEQLTLKMVRDL